MATDLQQARRRAQRQLKQLEDEFNALPDRMGRVRADIVVLDQAIAQSSALIDASAVAEKYAS